MTDTPGSLRLYPQPWAEGSADNVWPMGSLLLQKVPAPHFRATTKLHFDPQADERAGLLVFGTTYAWIGLEHSPEGRRVVMAVRLEANAGGPEQRVAMPAPPTGPVWLRADWHGGLVHFAVSFDSTAFTTIGPAFDAQPGRWVGTNIGLFAAGASSTRNAAEIDWFRVSPLAAAAGTISPAAAAP